MLIRNLNNSRKLLVSRNSISKKQLTQTPNFNMSTISQWMRKFMNRIKFEDNRAIQAKQDKVTLQIIQTPKQLQEKFIGDEQFKSIVEKERMQKIDQIIGTRTYFHQTKMYQERIDSDHVMAIDQLEKKHPQPKRQNLNWENPQAPEQYKVKSSRKFFRNLKNLREYPKHNYRITNFSDQKSQENIEFLGKESLFTKLSLKWVDTYQKSLQNETVEDVSYELQSHRYSPLYVYFSTSYQSAKLYRVQHEKYTAQLLTSVKKFTQLSSHIQEVISMEEIYNILKQHFHDQRVNEWLRKVENGEIGYMLSGYQTSKEEDKMVVWVDLLGTRKEYVHLYKNLRRKNTQNQLNKSKQKDNPLKQSVKSQSQQNPIQISNPQHQNSSIIHLPNSIMFNCRPNSAFSRSGQSIYLIQRSQQGTFVELISVPIQSSSSLGLPQVIFKCKPYEELEIWNDQGLGYVFLKIKEIGKDFDDKVFIVDEKVDGKGVDLIEVDLRNQELREQTVSQNQQTDQQNKPTQAKKISKSRLSLSTCPQGLIITDFYPTQNEFFKYGSSKQFATKISLIPYKQHIQLSQLSSSKTQRQYQLTGSTRVEKQRPSAHELDITKRSILYECPKQQFITEVSVRQSHIILSLSTLSIYSKKRLLFIPYEKSKNPHSLVFSTLSLSFINFGYSYTSQVVSFFINRSIVFNEYYQYTIWKKELKQLTDDNVYIEKVKLGENVQLTVTVLNRYLSHLPKFFLDKNQKEGQDDVQQYKLENSQVPVLIYLMDSKSVGEQKNNTPQSQTKAEVNLKKFLQKGALLITISCRGTLSSDLITFYNGSGQNFTNMLEDLQHAIQWIGNHFGSNISLYAKGPISGLAGMILNVKYPFLLTSTVLHDGVFELTNEHLMYDHLDYFVRYQNKERNSEEFMKFWKNFNPATFGYKKSRMMTKKMIEEQKRQKQEQQLREQDPQKSDLSSTTTSSPQSTSLTMIKPPALGTVQNIVISCSSSQFAKNQARRMIYHLRQNTNIKYDEVYLKEFLQGQDEELFNLAYIWGKMKERLDEEYRR